MRLIILLILSTALALSAAAADITLVDNGKSAYEIVLADGATRPAKLAASELQSFIERSTGVKLPIVTVASPDKPHLFVGPNSASAAAGVKPDDLKPEGFHLKVVGQDVHLVGRDTEGDPTTIGPNYPVQTGTLTAVYDFLERFLGVVFAWHDDLGTVVPRHDRVVIPATDITQNPDWSYRALSYSPEKATYELFGRRLRLGVAYTVSHGHNWFRILEVEKYAAEHPEYFALVNGERQAKHYLGYHGGQACTSNPEVIEIFAQAAIDYFKQYPDRDMFSMSPNDGGGFCECDNCRALDGGEFTEANPNIPVMTDRMIHFYNAIAEKVAKVYPDKKLGAYVYSYYKRPPVREKTIHPMLYLVQATNSAFGQGQGWADEHEGEKKWVAMTKHFDKYDIYYLGGPALHMMAPLTGHAIDRLKAEQAIGMHGGYLYIGQAYEQIGAAHYVMARLMWDGKADARKLEKQYYDALYGPASADVKQYYDLLEGRLRKVLLNGETVDEPAIKALTTRYESMMCAGDILAAYWPILDEAEKVIKQAEARPLSGEEKQRLARLRDHHDYMTATVRGMIAAGRLESQSAFDERDVAMLKSAVDAREDAKKRLAVHAPTMAGYLVEADKTETARVSPDGAFYQLTRKTKPLELVALPTDKPVKVDGLATDAAWRQATRYYMLLAKSAVPTELGARASLASDSENLYVFVEGREADAGKIAKATTAHDDTKIFDDDAVEVFIQPAGTNAYYQIAVGAGGGLYDGAHPTGDPAQGDVKWESNAKVATQITEGGWSAEIAIPFASFGVAPGEGWKANVFRTRRGNGSEYLAVNPTFSGYHVPARFAPLSFSGAAEATRFDYGTMDNLIAADLEKRLRLSQDKATAELVTDKAWCGSQALHISVPEGGLGSLTLTAKVRAGAGYRIVAAHLNSNVKINPAVRDEAPITRVIFRDDAGQAVTESKDYSWDGVNALEKPDQWRQTPHVFTAPERATQISYTMFFHHPGEYWVDEIRIEEM